MYGIKQAGNIWSSLLISYIRKLSFVKSSIDAHVFMKNVNNEFFIFVIIVDDVIYVSSYERLMKIFKNI